MLRQLLFLLIACSTTSLINADEGMYCGNGEGNNVFDRAVNTCSNLIYGDKMYCCKNFEKNTNYCCDALEYAKNGFGSILAAVIGVVAVVMLLIFCISCLCCTCCPWYRRRHRGTVYGKVQGPSVVQVIQTPGNVIQAPPAQPRHTPYAYPANQTAMPYPSAQAAPPQYTNEGYTKQSPYNPNYTH